MIPTKSNRKFWMDVLRILASFLVCFNHSDGYHVFLYQEADGSLLSWIFVVVCVLCRVSIPLFLMISGALMLGREESWSVILKKRVFRFTVILTAVSLTMYVLKHPGDFQWEGFLRDLFRGGIVTSYWYLYAYLSFLLMLPFLRRIAAGITGGDVAVLMGIRFLLLSVLPLVNYYGSYQDHAQLYLSGDVQLPMAMVNVIFYPLIGYYFANKYPMEHFGKWEAALCLLVCTVQTVVSTVVTYHEGIHRGFTQNYLALFDYAATAAVFLLVRRLLENARIPEKLASAAATFSGYVLGIYLMEPILAHFFYDLFFGPYYAMQLPEHRMLLSVVWAVLIMAGGSIVTWVIRRIPGGKKFL